MYESNTLGCLVQNGNGIELEAVGLLFKPYQWHLCGVTWDSSQTVVVIKLLQTSALHMDSDNHYMNLYMKVLYEFRYI